MRDSLLWVWVAGLVLAGCGESTSSSRLGDWTMTTETIRLTKTLQVSETEAFYFASVSDLAVTDDGRMLVADRKAKNIKVLRPDGSLIDTLGGPGEGPGEFQSLMSVQVARGDSVYAYDYRRSRLTVFAPTGSYTVARSISIPREQGYPLNSLVLGDQFLAVFSSGPRSRDEGVRAPPPQMWRVVHQNGAPADTLLRSRRGKMAVTSKGDAVWIQTIPFARRTTVRGGPGHRLYYGWTDSLHIRARTVRGETETIADIPAPTVPVSEAERDSAIQAVDENVRSVVASAIPDTKPAFTDFVVADDGRVWVQRPAAGVGADEASWWILDPDAKTITEVRLPRDIDVMVIRKAHVYGSTTTEMGAPAVVRYRIE